MLVKDLMSWPVITVFDSTTVGEAMDILRSKNIRHLPVVDVNSSLIGVVSETDLVNVFPNSKGLSTFESNLLSRTLVSKVMQATPITVSPSTIAEESALIMRKNRINCLPVMDNDHKLVGLLSKNDIIDAFISSLGLKEGGTRITIRYRKKWGFLSELIAFADKNNVCIDNFVSFGRNLVLKTKGPADDFVNQLKIAGYIVVDVTNIKLIK